MLADALSHAEKNSFFMRSLCNCIILEKIVTLIILSSPIPALVITAIQKRRRLCRSIRSHERNGRGHGRHRYLLPQVQGPAADSTRHPENQQRLQRALDGRLLLRHLGRGKETGRTQTGALGGHYQGVGHHLQENRLDKCAQAD